MTTETMVDAFALQLKAFRIKHGYTQEQAADLFRIGLSTLQHWETGKVIPKPLTRDWITDVMNRKVQP